MLRTFLVGMALCCAGIFASAQSATPNLNMPLPNYAAPNWNVQINQNLQKIDSAIGVLQVPFQGAWSSTTVYGRGVQVSYNSLIWISLINSNFNNTPNSNSTAWSQVPYASGGSGGTPSGPAYSVQIANPQVTGPASDPLITINPTTHTLSVGGAMPANTFTIGPHSTPPASWTLDAYTPQTAFASIVPNGSIDTSGNVLFGGTGTVKTSLTVNVGSFYQRLGSASLSGNRAFSLPDANSNSVVPLSVAPSGGCIAYIDALGVQHAATCGGTPSFSTMSSGTNTTASLVVGNGASLGPAGTGSVIANSYSGNLPVSNLNGGTSASGTTFWRGDGSWTTIPNASLVGSGTITVNGQSCTLGGSCTVPGSGGSGTASQYAFYSSSGTTVVGNSHLSDNGTIVTASEPLSIADGTGTGGALVGLLGTAPATSSSTDVLWADSTAARWKMNNANAGALLVTGISSPASAGDCPQFASNGIDVVDSGAPCGASAMTGTPTYVGDSGAGTSPTINLIGASDASGWVSLTVGTSPASSGGVVTIRYGGTYATIPKCGVQPANAAAASLSGAAQVYVAESQATVAQFVVDVGSTALTSATTYIWRWGCAL